MPKRTPATEAALACATRAHDAELLAASASPDDSASLIEAQKTLEVARNHYRRAKSLNCPADVLEVAANVGNRAASAIEAAENRAKAARESSRELSAKKARLSRAYELKGMFTREAARYVAESLVSKGLASDIVSAVQATIALLPCDPLDARPEHIFEAWLTLDPIPTHPFAAPAYAVAA